MSCRPIDGNNKWSAEHEDTGASGRWRKDDICITATARPDILDRGDGQEMALPWSHRSQPMFQSPIVVDVVAAGESWTCICRCGSLE
jgi:hypothetical protein